MNISTTRIEIFFSKCKTAIWRRGMCCTPLTPKHVNVSRQSGTSVSNPFTADLLAWSQEYTINHFRKKHSGILKYTIGCAIFERCPLIAMQKATTSPIAPTVSSTMIRQARGLPCPKNFWRQSSPASIQVFISHSQQSNSIRKKRGKLSAVHLIHSPTQ